jgi:hypothetical protein
MGYGPFPPLFVYLHMMYNDTRKLFVCLWTLHFSLRIEFRSMRSNRSIVFIQLLCLFINVDCNVLSTPVELKTILKSYLYFITEL